MKTGKYFDHILGEQNANVSKDDLRIFSRIIKAHSEDYSEEERMDHQRIGLHLRMKRYLSNPIMEITPTGEFLTELLEIYKVKKNKFAELIDYESTNLHAVLKGRRRMSNKIAIKIGAIFSIDPQLWMFIDAKNELAKYQQDNKISLKKYARERLKYAR